MAYHSLREDCGTLSDGRLGSVTLVLDASESASSSHAAMISLAQGLERALPADAQGGIYFLGSATRYQWAELPSRIGTWLAANRGRASLIGPVAGALEKGDHGLVLVIGSGQIFDLDDWIGTPALRSLLLVSVDESLQPAPELAEEMMLPDAFDLAQRADDPVASLEIAGPGFMPIWWDNPDYHLVMREGNVALTADRPARCEVTVSYLVRQDGVPEVRLVRVSGACGTAPLRPAVSRARPAAASGTLSPEEQQAATCATRRQPYRCPRCGSQHAWHELRCTEYGGIFGEPLYRSFPAGSSGFLVLRQAVDAWHWELHPGAVLRLGPGEVALRDAGHAARYSYDPGMNRWRAAVGDWQTYQEVGAGAYAILL